ncbi:hypothetical protein LTR66_002170 [Elasticomyces elasticus]|nr:hypothetical protein LTR66_002170 [Elasticomyces elasticus]
MYNDRASIPAPTLYSASPARNMERAGAASSPPSPSTTTTTTSTTTTTATTTAAAVAAATRSPHISSIHLTTRTSSRGALRHNKPPPTAAQSRRRQAERIAREKGPSRARMERHSPESSLRDDAFPSVSGDSVATSAVAMNPRHSHGLSWSSITKDSVVDNMLSSLHRIPSQDLRYTDHRATPEDSNEDDYVLAPTSSFSASSLDQRARSHRYSASLSDFHRQVADDVSSRYSTQLALRARRSNSTTDFAPSNDHSAAVRPRWIGRSSSETHRPPRAGAHLRGMGRNGSKSSDGSSLDYGYSQVLGTSKWDIHDVPHRSASVDCVYTERMSRSLPAESVLARGRPVPSVHSKYEGEWDAPCPEPVVASGPRRAQPAPTPFSLDPAQSTNATPRKLSALRLYETGSVSQPEHAISQEIRKQASDFVRASSMREMSPLPASGDRVAPSPSVARRKESASPTEASRHKPGFFQRVFGSSKSNVHNHNDLSAPASQMLSRSLDHTSIPSRQPSQLSHVGQNHVAAHIKSATKPVLKENPATSKEQSQQTLNKKPSSFFRRRKKSISEQAKYPVPPLPLESGLKVGVPAVLPSPSVSSLRKVMDPYLSNEVRSANHENGKLKEFVRPTTSETIMSEDDDNLAIFHSGYTRPPDASIGIHSPTAESVAPSEPSLRGLGSVEAGPTTSWNSPRMRLKRKKVRPQALQSDKMLANRGDAESASISTISPTFGDHLGTRSTPVSPMSIFTPLKDHKDMDLSSRPSTGERIIASEAASPVDRASRPGDFPPRTSSRDEDGWVVTMPNRPVDPLGQDSNRSSKSNRIWLTPSEEKLDEADKLSIPLGDINSPAASPITPAEEFHSATSLPIVQIDGDDMPKEAMPETAATVPSATGIITEQDRDRAQRIFDGDEEFVPKAQAASWLGENNPVSSQTRKAYMELFDWYGQNILQALRGLCDKLVLKGETQQVDRVLGAFSIRWCECNPSHGFKATDIVHTICYSLLLLNTDLHLADIEQKMTRTQFIKNTLPTIKRIVKDAAPEAFDETIRANSYARRPSVPWIDSSASVPMLTSMAADTVEERPSLDLKRRRLSIRPPLRTESDSYGPDSAPPSTASNTLVMHPWDGPLRAWEFEVETVLKDFYSSIRSQALPLHGSQPLLPGPTPSNNSLSVYGLKRSGSVVSKAPSENMSYRSRRTDFHSMTSRWHPKNRGRPKMYPTSTVGSSRTSLDDGNSLWSPANSSTWSKYSMGKTQTSLSVDSFGSHLVHGDYKQSIGFTNALSQAIIREEGTVTADSESFTRVDTLLEDETLELAGAPWAKEGILKHKHHLETPDKKAKDRNWNECFAVIEKGWLRLFSFNSATSTKTVSGPLRSKQRGHAPSIAASVVGGGNWIQNAEALGSFLLRQTIASTLPPPGYSKTRPHVWALSLPTGAVHLFQVGTPDIAREFMSTANYWSARLSKEPLFGGVSNIEYGWSDSVVNTALISHGGGQFGRTDSLPTKPWSAAGMSHDVSGSVSLPRPSMQSSLRGSLDQGFGSVRARLPGDKVAIQEWSRPTQSMATSQLMEVDQLRQLVQYVGKVEEELGKHNELRAAVNLAFSPRNPNHARALANWEKKSAYLLKEIVKFRMYIDSLSAAQAAKEKIYAERAAQKTAQSDVKAQEAEHASFAAATQGVDLL